jgi:hypothetical protein
VPGRVIAKYRHSHTAARALWHVDENALKMVERLGKPGLSSERLVHGLTIDDRQSLQQKLALTLWKQLPQQVIHGDDL